MLRDWFPAYVHIVIDFEHKCGEALFKKMCKRIGYFMLCSQTLLPDVLTLLTAKSNKSEYAAKY